jgi:hypothetical protein
MKYTPKALKRTGSSLIEKTESPKMKIHILRTI